jgi:hypothetical protein
MDTKDMNFNMTLTQDYYKKCKFDDMEKGKIQFSNDSVNSWDDLSININGIVENTLLNKIRQDFMELFYTEDIILVNVSDDHDLTDIELNVLRDGRKKYCITNSRVGSAIAQDRNFISSEMQLNNKTGTIYKIGNFMNMEVYVDSYIPYSDGKVILFDSLNYNIIYSNTVDDGGCYTINYTQAFEPINPSAIYYSFDGSLQEEYDEIMIPVNRNLIIDSLL